MTSRRPRCGCSERLARLRGALARRVADEVRATGRYTLVHTCGTTTIQHTPFPFLTGLCVRAIYVIMRCILGCRCGVVRGPSIQIQSVLLVNTATNSYCTRIRKSIRNSVRRAPTSDRVSPLARTEARRAVTAARDGAEAGRKAEEPGAGGADVRVRRGLRRGAPVQGLVSVPQRLTARGGAAA